MPFIALWNGRAIPHPQLPGHSLMKGYRMAQKIVTPECPICKQPPEMVIGDTAFCTTDGCKALMWDITVPLDELLMNTQIINLPETE